MTIADAGEPTRRVLVAYASRMGSTQEIATVIGEELGRAGLLVDVLPCADDPDPTAYDAVVIGSAIYTRRWHKPANRYLKSHLDELAARPTWLFHSGPCGEGAESEQVAPPPGVAKRAARIGAAPPMTFGGRLETEHATGPISRWMATNGPLSGDFRDWARIRAWAAGIAEGLRSTTPPVGTGHDEQETERTSE